MHNFAFFVLRRVKRARAAGRCADWAAGFSAPPPAGMVFCRKQRKKLQKKAPLPGELSAKLTERLSQIWYDLSVSAFRRATSPGRGGLGERTPMASPMRGSCRRRRLMRWGQLRRRRSVHLIRHGSAVPPSPRRGRHKTPGFLSISLYRDTNCHPPIEGAELAAPSFFLLSYAGN